MNTQTHRQSWMGLLAKSPAKTVTALVAPHAKNAPFEWLRTPEVGGVMVQGRMGGTGAPFNMGEVTVTRCSLRLSSGEIGHGYVQGRDKTHAQYAALVDALMQSPNADAIESSVLAPLRDDALQRAAQTQHRADQTKVDFFTLVRGED